MPAEEVCAKCGSEDIWYDARAKVNDPEYVILFDAVFCDDCGTETYAVQKTN